MNDKHEQHPLPAACADMRHDNKYEHLLSILHGYGSVAVAFSGGVDSTLLLYAAREALGDGVIAVTARSCSFPVRELEAAREFCSEHGIRHFVTDSEELDIEGFASNPPDRCYICKTELFSRIWEIARREGMAHVAEGSNLDDESDYRPGLRAVSEQGVKSPLREAGFAKDDVRGASAFLGLPTAGKQSFACLSSRFAYGETITGTKLKMVDRAEQLLLDLGFTQVRVRVHGKDGEQARIEIMPYEFAKIMDAKTRERVFSSFTGFGFKYVSLDLAGYRTGSMNATLP